MIEAVEKREKEAVIGLLQEQVELEGKLVSLYRKTAGEIQSKPVHHLLHTVMLDSMKHIDFCQTALEILHGEDVLKEEKGIC